MKQKESASLGQSKLKNAVKRVDALEGKQKVLEATLAQIDKEFGSGAAMRLGQSAIGPIDVISTGSLLVDQALGVGGFPKGRIIEVFGPEASGKTTLALQVIAQAQESGGVCAFIDAEHALDPTYAKNIGINIDELIVSQPDYGEQALDIAEMLIRSGAVDVIVVDSVAALVPKAEIEGDMGDIHVGLHARLMSQALRKLTAVVHRSKTVLIFINQVRQNISAMPFAKKEVTTGGNALKFYSSLRIEVRRIAGIKRGDQHVGNRLLIRIVKNKVAPPFRTVELDLMFSEGLSRELEILDLSIQHNIIKQSGAWFSFENANFAQGRDQAYQALKNDAEFFQKVRGLVSDALQKREKVV